MADELTGRAGGGGSDSGAPPSPSVGPVPWRPALDPARAPDRTPVTFEQHVDGDWLHWSVVEVDARAVPGARGARCLVFTRRDCIRRVWEYPSDWRALDGAGLAALSWHR